MKWAAISFPSKHLLRQVLNKSFEKVFLEECTKTSFESVHFVFLWLFQWCDRRMENLLWDCSSLKDKDFFQLNLINYTNYWMTFSRDVSWSRSSEFWSFVDFSQWLCHHHFVVFALFIEQFLMSAYFDDLQITGILTFLGRDFWPALYLWQECDQHSELSIVYEQWWSSFCQHMPINSLIYCLTKWEFASDVWWNDETQDYEMLFPCTISIALCHFCVLSSRAMSFRHATCISCQQKFSHFQSPSARYSHSLNPKLKLPRRTAWFVDFWLELLQ